MNQYIVQQWRRINTSCHLMAKHFKVEIPENMKVSSGNPYQRMRDRTTALADFLDRVSSEIEAKAKVEETQPDGEVDEAKVESNKPPKKTSRRKK